ncbi:MAG: hypothetical protein HY459_03085 [Parcubacteria group bacterium]|nr:hypothetical protein [Parcubacteria group bacterium]
MKRFFLTLLIVALLPISSFAESETNEPEDATQSPRPTSTTTVIRGSTQRGDALRRAKENFETTVDRMKNARSSFLEGKERFKRGLLNAQETEEFLTHAKTFFGNTVNAIINHLDALVKRIESMGTLSEETKNTLLAEVNATKDEATALLAKIEAAATTDELRSLREEIETLWHKVRRLVRRISAGALVAHVERFLNRLAQAAERARERLNALRDSGVDISSLEESYNAAKAAWQAARDALREAQEIFAGIATASDTGTLFKDGHEALKEAEGKLREAHKAWQEFLKELRRLPRPSPSPSPSASPSESPEPTESPEPSESPTATATP